MGTWDKGSFDNDSALDWLHHLNDTTDDSALYSVFNTVTENNAYIDADDGASAIAAAEIVAAWNGYSNPDLPASAIEWLNNKPAINFCEIKKLATQAVLLVRNSTNSELRELWTEGGTEFASEWYAVIDDLIFRLEQPK